MATRCLEGSSGPRLDNRVFDSAMQAFNDLAARSRIQHVCSRPNCAHLYTSEVEAAEAEAQMLGTPLRIERMEGPTSELATYAFGREKVITFDGTFFANSSAMRDDSEASLHNVCKPDPEAPRVAGGFTPLSIGGMCPSDVPLEGIDCPWKYRNGLSELRPAVQALALRWCNFRKAPAQGSNAPLKPKEFVAMRERLSTIMRALMDLVIESGGCADPAACAVCKAVPRRPWMQGFLKEGPVGATGWCPTHFQPYAALLHALLIPRYSWVFGHVVTLRLLRHLLLEGPLDERGMAYLSSNGPMLAAILRLHPVAGVAYAFPPMLRLLIRDIYATNLLCFEPSANRPSSSSRSPLAALHDATEHLWTIEAEKLRIVGQLDAAAMEYAGRHGAALKRAADRAQGSRARVLWSGGLPLGAVGNLRRAGQSRLVVRFPPFAVRGGHGSWIGRVRRAVAKRDRRSGSHSIVAPQIRGRPKAVRGSSLLAVKTEPLLATIGSKGASRSWS
jgi:hypothetical protein